MSKERRVCRSWMALTVMITFFVCPFYNVIVFAEDNISSWAVEEVTLAVEDELVPSELTNDYKTNIKRYEYVLLALELLDIKNDTVSIGVKYPFGDIRGHEYEEEIVRAYNAGIIKGYGDGTFKPDETITRQEIASLIVNLVERLDQKEIEKVPLPTLYSDYNSIGSWATEYINYCYKNDIIKGTGTDSDGNVRIEPLGTATREQAILMLYRLASEKGFAGEVVYDSITIKSFDSEKNTFVEEESEIVNDFFLVFGEDITEAVIDISNDSESRVESMSKDYCLVEYDDGSNIWLSQNGMGIDVYVRYKHGEEVDLEHFYSITELLYTDSGIEDAVARDLYVLEADKTYESYLTLTNNINYSIELNDVSGVEWITIKFEYMYN